MSNRRKEPTDRRSKALRVLVPPKFLDEWNQMIGTAGAVSTELGRQLYGAVLDEHKRTGKSPQEIVDGMKSSKQVPVQGLVGMDPDFDIQYLESASAMVPDFIDPPPDSYCLLAVGDSMTYDGNRSIPSDSFCLFRPTSCPTVGNLVHAEYMEAGRARAVLKEFGGYDKKRGVYKLVSLNPESANIEVKKGDLEVRGELLTHWSAGGQFS